MKTKIALIALWMLCLVALSAQYGGVGTFEKMGHLDTVTTGYYVITSVLPTPHTNNVAGVYGMGNKNPNATSNWFDATLITTELTITEIENPDVNIVWYIEEVLTGVYTLKRLDADLYANVPSDATAVNLSDNPASNTARWKILSNTEAVPFRIQSEAFAARHLRYRAELATPGRFNTVVVGQANSHDITLFKLSGEPAVVPQITNITSISTAPVVGEPLTVSATVVYDEASALTVSLKYSRNDVETSIPMAATGNVYSATIPASEFTNGDKFELFIEVNYGTPNPIITQTQRFFSGITPIKTIRTRTGNTNADLAYRNYIFKIQGVAIMNDRIFDANRNEFHIQDETAGILIFRAANVAIDLPAQLEGTLIEASGLLEFYQESLQLNANPANNGNIVVVGNKPMPEPVVGTIAFFNNLTNRETYASQLIGIAKVNKVQDEVWPNDASAHVFVSDGTGSMALRVFQLSDAIGTDNEPTWPVDVTGVLGYNATGSTPIGNRLLIRGLKDIHEEGVLPVTITSFTVSATANSAIISWVTESEINMSGYRILKNQTNNFETAIEVNFTAANNIPTSQTYNYIDTDVNVGITYYYWLEAIELDGSSELKGPVDILIPIEPTIPPVDNPTRLLNVYPNPITTETGAKFEMNVRSSETATLRIFNIKGQLIREFAGLSGTDLTVNWDGRDNNNRETAAGMYFYQLSSPSYYSVHRMVILRH